jgi:hypothetical protein
MRRLSSRHRAKASTTRLAAPLMGLALALALFVVACSAGGNSSSSSAGSGGRQSQTFPTPPAIQTTPPVATAVGTEQPAVLGVPGIKPTMPGQIPAFSADDMASYVMQHGLPNVSMNGTPTVTQKIFIPNSEVEQLTGYTTGFGADSMIGYVELQGSFAFPTPPDVPAIQLTVAYMLFNTVNGDIVGWGGLKQPSTIPTATPVPTQPTATPTTAPPTTVPPTATTVPQNPPVLTVRPQKTTAFCSNNSYPNTITVANSGSGTLNWSATAPSGVTLTPSSGSLAAGASQTVALSGAYTATTSFVVHFTSNGGSADVTIECEIIS